jgi:hypothetical protein
MPVSANKSSCGVHNLVPRETPVSPANRGLSGKPRRALHQGSVPEPVGSFYCSSVALNFLPLM